MSHPQIFFCSLMFYFNILTFFNKMCYSAIIAHLTQHNDKLNRLLNKQGSKFDQRAVPINRFLFSTTVQNFTYLSYSFCVTIPIIGAGRWHVPKHKRYFFSQRNTWCNWHSPTTTTTPTPKL